MFGGYAEGMAYAAMCGGEEFGVPLLPHNSDDDDCDIICSEVVPSTSLFGGFKAWPQENTDFILIAECSEICGPNPICTIPSNIGNDVDLSSLSVLILSADFQEFSSNKSVPTKDTQVLMPDIMENLHAAVNHFVIYDPEARGFVRSLCMAYITSDKHKLVEMDKDIFKHFADASFLIQHSNKQFSKGGLITLAEDLECTKAELTSRAMIYPTDISEDLKLYDDLIKSSLQDIQDIFSCINSSLPTDGADELINNFVDQLTKKFNPEGCFNFILETNNKTRVSKPKILKLPIQQDFDKRLRYLFTVSPGGALMAFYHLHLIHKYFRRKFENIFVESCDESEDNHICNVLHFGACLKLNSWVKDQDSSHCDVDFCDSRLNLSFHSKSYASGIDADFCNSILNILKSMFCDTHNLESIVLAQPKPKEKTCMSLGVTDLECNRHTVPLNKMWNVLEYLNFKTPEIESSAVQFLQIFPWTEDIFFSLLTHVPIIILYNFEDDFLVRNIVRVLAAFVPRISSENLVVEHNREQVLRKEDLKNIAVATFCLQHKNLKLMSYEVKPLVSVLHVKSSSYHGQKYIGFLLNGINNKIKAMTPEQPLFSFLISVFSEIERHVKFWEKISLSASSSHCRFIMAQKGFSKCDMKILKHLSKMNFYSTQTRA